MEEETLYTHSDELIYRICAVIQNEPTCLPFLQHCLVFCLLHVGDPQAISMLQQRDCGTWQSIILGAFWYEESKFIRKWSAYCVGRLLNLSEPGIPTTLLDEPWDDLQEDITPAELRCIYSVLFDVKLGEPRIFGKSEQQRLGTSLEQSELFKGRTLPHTLEWYETIKVQIPIFLPVWFKVIPPSLMPRLGIRVLMLTKAFISDLQAKCPSLGDHKNCFLIILICHALYPWAKNSALNEWKMSLECQNLYHSLMNTFWSTKDPVEYLLVLAVFLCVQPYRNMFSAHGAHQPSNDPLPDLGAFVEGQGPIKRRVILEKTAFSAIRVLGDENFTCLFKEPRRVEYKHLSTILKCAVGKKPTMLGCLEGTLDRYCRTRIDSPMDHPEAFKISLMGLGAAKRPPHSFSFSRTTSSTTMNGNIRGMTETCKAENVHFESDPMIEAGSKQISGTPDHVFSIHFLGRRGVGKSAIVNRAVNECYINEYNPTVDRERHSKTLRVSGKICKLDIVDIEGQDLVSAPEQMHTKVKDVLVLVYDTTSKRSFKDISSIFDAHEHPRNVITVLVGNKTDLEEQREVQKHEGMELAHKLGASFWEVSALKGYSINEMFQRMAFLVLDRQCYSLNGETEANTETPEKDFMDLETPQMGFWNIFCRVIFPCMGRA